MLRRHLMVGEAGEKLAAAYLARRGLRSLERRVRCGRGEVDIVARDGAELVFVEVKTRSSDRMGRAAEGVTRRKAGRLYRAVQAYLAARGLENHPVRLDLVAIDYDAAGQPVVEHVPGGIRYP
ncbi:MAG: YraN family protein [Planctomycetes bacterium]|nr:YraN family protein [Planctomycetota bacterium]